jgi:hypothetical protein
MTRHLSRVWRQRLTDPGRVRHLRQLARNEPQESRAGESAV